MYYIYSYIEWYYYIIVFALTAIFSSLKNFISYQKKKKKSVDALNEFII